MNKYGTLFYVALIKTSVQQTGIFNHPEYTPYCQNIKGSGSCMAELVRKENPKQNLNSYIFIFYNKKVGYKILN